MHERDRESLENIFHCGILFQEQIKIRLTTLTSFDGDPVGTVDGLVEGETDGPLDPVLAV